MADLVLGQPFVSSQINLKQYEDWIKTNQITLPIHGVEGDFEAKKMQWGVKALPWLILTDNQRVVKGEGFAIGELDPKLAGEQSP